MQIWAASATYTIGHSNAGSLTYWARPGIEPTTSWFLIGFVSIAPRWKILIIVFYFNLFFIKLWLLYNVLISAVQKSELVIHTHTHTHIYIYSFLYSLPLQLIPGDWMYFPVLYSRMLFIHSKCNSLHLITPNSQSISLPPPSSLATISLFSMSVSLFLFCR